MPPLCKGQLTPKFYLQKTVIYCICLKFHWDCQVLGTEVYKGMSLPTSVLANASHGTSFWD